MISLKRRIEQEIHEVLTRVGVSESTSFSVERTENKEHGDYASNVALAASKSQGIKPHDLAEKIATELATKSNLFKKVEMAGPGFINFFITDEALTEMIADKERLLFPKRNEQALFEYTDPNCFKVFHIGHLMANTVGESLSRLFETVGYDVTRVCYPSDIGLNVAKGVWGAMELSKEKPGADASLKDKVSFLGRAYAYAHAKYEESGDGSDKKKIIEVNKAIYEGTNAEVMEAYAEGRALSLLYFESLYKRLGTNFDAFIYESEVGELGKSIVEAHLGKLFEKSDGAIVYKGEQDGLHTRVFINSIGLPTYEAKDLGNYEKKLELLPSASKYVVITANEQNDYFKVLNKVEEKLHPELIGKLVHVGHGILRLPEGKMSSRTGNVVGAEDLLNTLEIALEEKFKDRRVEEEDKKQLIQDIAVGAVKFTIVRQSPGRDIIFDTEKSISFEGDSGPYLQYTHARICELLKKGLEEGVTADLSTAITHEHELEIILSSYKEIVEHAYNEFAPQHITEYLLTLARAFNSFYARQVIIDKENKESAYYMALSEKVRDTLKHGLYVLGIVAPEKM